MRNRNKNAKWSFKDHGFVYDIENVKNEYKHKVQGRLALKKEYEIIYNTWREMAKRTTNPEYQAKHPTYKDTWVCEEWKYFSNFLNWYLENGHRKGLQLDKDIIDINNKCYSPDTCVFVSSAINNLLIYKQSGNSGLPIGVSYQQFDGKGHKRSKPYQVQFSINGKQKSFKRYATPEEAGLVYGREKSKYIRQVADNLSEEDCAKCHIDIVKAALYNHADSLEKQTQARYGQFKLFNEALHRIRHQQENLLKLKRELKYPCKLLIQKLDKLLLAENKIEKEMKSPNPSLLNLAAIEFIFSI